MKPSRMRRVEVVNSAIDAVYKNQALTYHSGMNPYKDERCHRIFEKYYNQWCNMYNNMEGVCRDMEDVYGFIGTKRGGL